MDFICFLWFKGLLNRISSNVLQSSAFTVAPCSDVITLLNLGLFYSHIQSSKYEIGSGFGLTNHKPFTSFGGRLEIHIDAQKPSDLPSLWKDHRKVSTIPIRVMNLIVVASALHCYARIKAMLSSQQPNTESSALNILRDKVVFVVMNMISKAMLVQEITRRQNKFQNKVIEYVTFAIWLQQQWHSQHGSYGFNFVNPGGGK